MMFPRVMFHPQLPPWPGAWRGLPEPAGKRPRNSL